MDCAVFITGDWRLAPSTMPSSHAERLVLIERKARPDADAEERTWYLEDVMTTQQPHTEQTRTLKSTLYGCLLPKGYPDTVAPEYMEYQLWDALQVMMADLRSIIIQQAGLIGLGVGSADATPIAALHIDAVVGVLGTFLSLISGSVCNPGKSAATMKSWRIYNTLLLYFSAALALVEGMMPSYRIYTKCIGTT